MTLSQLSQEAKSAGGWLASMLDATGLQYGGAENITRPFEEDGWVHACLRTIASAVREVPLRFWSTDPATDPDATPVADSHELVRLFQRPNPSMSAATFREAGVLHRKLDGEDFWLLYGKDGQPWDGQGFPEHIHPVRGSAMQVEQDERGHVVGWRVAIHGGQQQVFPPQAIVHFRDYDPDNPLRGLGDVEVLLRDLEIGFQAQRYMDALVTNSGDPGGVIEVKGPAVTREEQQSLEEQAAQEFQASERGRWRVVQGEDINYKPNSISPKDMEFGRLFEWLRDKTASVLGVPLPVVGVLERATYDNYEHAVRMFWKGGNGIIPYLRTVEDGINSHFLPRLRGSERLVARFDVSQIEALQDDMGGKIETARKLKERFPELSFHEVAQMVGLEVDELEVGDLRLVPAGVTTLDRVLEDAEAEPEEPSEEEPAGGEEDPPEEEGAAAELFELREGEGEEPEPEVDEAEAAAAERSAYWDGIEERVYKPGEGAVAKSYRGWSKGYEKAVLKRLESYAKNGDEGKAFRASRASDELFFGNELSEADIQVLLVNREEWASKMDDALAGDLATVFEVSASDLAAELGADAIDVQQPDVLEALARQRFQLVEGHTSTLEKKVRESLLRVFAGNENQATLQEHVRDQLPALTEELKRVFGTREARALTIARTETAHASNGARFMQMKKSGVETHEWVTSGDQRVRGHPDQPPTNHSHFELDGNEVPIGEAFARKLKFPSDPEADASDVINCRCITRAGKRTEEDL